MDDGHLDNAFVEWADACISQVGGSVRVVNKSHQPGLHLSRLMSLALAQYPVVTFLDDDVEVLPGYFRELQATFDSSSELVGLGGVNINEESKAKWRKLVERLFLLRSRAIGRLTASCFNWSHDEWASRSQSFPADFLLGCNMSLRVEAVKDIRQVPYFEGYSLGEDVYLCIWAARRGALAVNPNMRVVHHFAPTGRLDYPYLWREMVRSSWEISGLRSRTLLHVAAFSWSILGLFVGQAIAMAWALIRSDRAECKRRLGALLGISRGVWMIVSGRHAPQHP